MTVRQSGPINFYKESADTSLTLGALGEIQPSAVDWRVAARRLAIERLLLYLLSQSLGAD